MLRGVPFRLPAHSQAGLLLALSRLLPLALQSPQTPPRPITHKLRIMSRRAGQYRAIPGLISDRAGLQEPNNSHCPDFPAAHSHAMQHVSLTCNNYTFAHRPSYKQGAYHWWTTYLFACHISIVGSKTVEAGDCPAVHCARAARLVWLVWLPSSAASAPLQIGAAFQQQLLRLPWHLHCPRLHPRRHHPLQMHKATIKYKSGHPSKDPHPLSTKLHAFKRQSVSIHRQHISWDAKLMESTVSVCGQMIRIKSHAECPDMIQERVLQHGIVLWKQASPACPGALESP